MVINLWPFHTDGSKIHVVFTEKVRKTVYTRITEEVVAGWKKENSTLTFCIERYKPTETSRQK